MCGIAGILNYRSADPARTASKMIGAMRYRGPDDAGSLADASAGLGLGHARLSILDLSPDGHQPMVSASGRYVMTFNGAGGITGRKNLRRLFQALATIPEIGGEPVRLVMTNARAHQPLLSGWANEFRIAERLVLLDKVDRTVLRQWYFAADAVVYPSLWEGFGLPILEAMSTGAPIAVSAVSCLPEIGGGYAEYFNPLDVQDMARAMTRALRTGRRPAKLPAEYTLAPNLERFALAFDLQGETETKRSRFPAPGQEPVRL